MYYALRFMRILACWPLLIRLLIIPEVLGQLPPLLPTNEQELRKSLDDISYSVKKITSPDFKVSSTIWERLLRSLEGSRTPQPEATQNALRGFSGTVGSIGRFILNIINWSIELAKDIKQKKVVLGTINVTETSPLSSNTTTTGGKISSRR